MDQELFQERRKKAAAELAAEHAAELLAVAAQVKATQAAALEAKLQEAKSLLAEGAAKAAGGPVRALQVKTRGASLMLD